MEIEHEIDIVDNLPLFSGQIRFFPLPGGCGSFFSGYSCRSPCITQVCGRGCLAFEHLLCCRFAAHLFRLWLFVLGSRHGRVAWSGALLAPSFFAWSGALLAHLGAILAHLGALLRDRSGSRVCPRLPCFGQYLAGECRRLWVALCSWLGYRDTGSCSRNLRRSPSTGKGDVQAHAICKMKKWSDRCEGLQSQSTSGGQGGGASPWSCTLGPPGLLAM